MNKLKNCHVLGTTVMLAAENANANATFLYVFNFYAFTDNSPRILLSCHSFEDLASVTGPYMRVQVILYTHVDNNKHETSGF